ncbi:MAG TPA: dihydrolipoyl dehydrogenase [Parachlamydiaceae bacterium]|nr:dihydrolipoyl dehydrogenase [Parachlamydiaceae bacterium]
METSFDAIVIGGGPGGYPAAIKLAQLGKKTALIEANELGGTCLNRGCIPSKTLIANAEVLEKLKSAEEFGIQVKDISFDYAKMAKRKDEVVSKIGKSLKQLILSNGITLFKGFGKFISPNEIKITGETNVIVSADTVIIATGSEPKNIPAFPCDHTLILDSTDLLNRTTLPKKIAIIGGGIIGCEFASLYAAFGVEVALIEMLPRILPMESLAISEALTKAFLSKGIQIKTSAQVSAIDKTATGIQVRLKDDEPIDADIALVAVGRKLNTNEIGLEKAGLTADENGFIKVNDKMETIVPGIYAVGDIASKWWLAHVASHQGLIAASNACGILAHMHYNAIPSAIFTVPEIATVGLSLEQAKSAGFSSAIVSAFPFAALGKSVATGETEGFAQIVTDKRTGQILGAQVVGYQASSLISEMAVAIANELTVESISDTVHAHPTLPESFAEAALLATGMPLHLPKKGRK